MSAAKRRKQELCNCVSLGQNSVGGAGRPPTGSSECHASRSGAVALLEFFLAAARARIVATNVLQGIAHRLLVSVAAVRAVDMAVVVIMVIVIVVAVRTMDMGLLSH